MYLNKLPPLLSALSEKLDNITKNGKSTKKYGDSKCITITMATKALNLLDDPTGHFGICKCKLYTMVT